ncbi:MAG TPA: hypothetical protein VEU32_15855 [Burkholderiales bacterium]|nr:hypothetical protein [Burkholderiales bacterium]
MKRLFAISLLAFATTVGAQNRSADLDRAYEETRSAYIALQQAIARRDQGGESLPGERTGSAAGDPRAGRGNSAQALRSCAEALERP